MVLSCERSNSGGRSWRCHDFYCAHRDLLWIFVDSCFCAAIIASVSTVLAFRRCVTHVRSAGRPHFLCSRRLFFSRSLFLLLLSYFLLCLGRTAAGCTAVENDGGGLWCHVVIPWSSPQHKQFSSQLGFLVFVLDVCLCWRVLPAETGENSICPVFNLRVSPRIGANRRVYITAFWYLTWLKHLFDTFYFWER